MNFVENVKMLHCFILDFSRDYQSQRTARWCTTAVRTTSATALVVRLGTNQILKRVTVSNG